MSEKSGFIGRFIGRYERNLLIKDKKIAILSTLIVIGSCFFYAQMCHFGPKCYQNDFGNKIVFSSDFKNSDLVESLKNKEMGLPKDRFSDKIQNRENSFEKELYAIVGEYPIKEMVPFIANKSDRRVAALVVGIAKKESDWGRHSPSKGGATCYNFWGYKGAGSRGTAMGYGCFATAEEGVEAIAGRIQELVNKKVDNPSRMVVWKCGSSCAGHDPAGVRKWISDVSLYFNKIVKTEG
jgi:hypothetical protein